MPTDEHHEKDPRFDLGVLFVHGIGRQMPGDTLVEFGEPIIRWLERWFVRTGDMLDGEVDEAAVKAFREQREQWRDKWVEDKDDPVVIEDRVEAVINAAQRDLSQRTKSLEERLTSSCHKVCYIATRNAAIVNADGPATAEVTVGSLSNGVATEKHWLFSESCWAQSFTEPGYRKMVVWSFTSFPWAIGAHFGRRVRLNSGLDKLKAVIALLIAMAAVPFVMLFLVLTLILAVIPLRPFRQPFTAVQQLMATYLGDSYILLEDPIKSAAVIGRFSKDLKSLSARCRKVVIVAHSQGAAVTYFGLRNWVPPNLSRVVTFGSGLRKIHELYYLRKGLAKDTQAGIFIMLASILLGIGAYVVVQSGGLDGAKGYLIMGTILFLATCVSFVEQKPMERFSSSIDRILDSKVAWSDFYALADPVSNGPLFEPSIVPGSSDDRAEATKRKRLSTPVVNFGSMLRDHTTYWQNSEEFVSRIVREFVRVPGAAPKGLLEGASIDLDAIHTRRLTRSRLLSFSFWSCMFGLVIDIGARIENWLAWVRTVSAWVLAPIERLTTSALIPIRELVSQIPVLQELVKNSNRDNTTEKVVNGVPLPSTDAIRAVIMIVGFYLVARILWAVWAYMETRELFTGRRSGFDRIVILGAFSLVAPLPLLLAILDVLEQDYCPEVTFFTAIAPCDASIAFTGYLAVIVMLFWKGLKVNA